LSIELRKSKDEGIDIYCAVTNAIKSEAAAVSSGSAPSHFESSLRYNLVFEKVSGNTKVSGVNNK
jgi:hypothetical protein